MDSRLIAGAYSQHFRALEREEKEHDERTDSIARAKKLSQETNKRRKIQAQKRKLEAKREEQRRQEILTKRREEQKQATEKYQRSHVPAGQRQNSGRLSPQRYGAPCLEDALQLIRRSPRRERPTSGRERVHSPKHENDDPLKRSYFNKPRHHSARPSSGRSNHQLNNEARAELMDYSLKNLTSSKSLFEQQLEQQQNILLQKQQQSLKEFSNAVQRELEAGQVNENEDSKGDVDSSESLSGSCSSLDSLERSDGYVRNLPENDKNTDRNCELIPELSNTNNDPSRVERTFYLNSHSSEKDHGGNTLSGQNYSPLNQDMTNSAIYQSDHTVDFKEDVKRIIPHSTVCNGVTKLELLEQQNSNIIQGSPLKQMSGDSLEESVSSGSNISLIKMNENNDITNLPISTDIDKNNGYLHQNSQLKQQNAVVMNNQNNSEKGTNEIKDKGENLAHRQNNQYEVPSSNVLKVEPQSTELGQGGSRNESVIESYNPRYASAIGLSIWPGQPHSTASSNSFGNTAPNNLIATTASTTNNNNSPYGKRTSSVILAPSPTNSTQEQNAIVHTSALQNNITGNHNKDIGMNIVQGTSVSPALSVNPTVVNAKPRVQEIDNMLHSFKKQDLIYPLSQNLPESTNIPQNHSLLPPHSSTYNTLQEEIKQLSDRMLENNNIMTTAYSSSPIQNAQNASTSTLASTTLVSPSPLTHQTEKVQMIHHIPHGNDFVSGPVPVPAVRTIFPTSRPPVPKVSLGHQAQSNNQQIQKVSPNAEDSSKSSKPIESARGETGSVEEDADNTKTLKGILKQLPPKVPAQGNQKGAVQARDSLELAKMQSEKKVKKKSVRWAAFLEETEDDYNNVDQPNAHAVGTGQYKQAISRPASAKVVSQSALATKPMRAASAGSVRQPMSQIHQANLPQNINIPQTMSKSNLPPNFSQPLNTNVPINRPKAAAHIIMSSDSHHPIHKDGSSSPTSPTASSLHKSQLEVKVKAVNNNFMSKVPVKVNANTTAEVYHVSSNPANIGIIQGDHSQQKDVQTQQNAERSRIRDNTLSKRVPLSNSTVTRTSIVPASTKINYPHPNGVTPSYSTTNNINPQGPSSSTFDESKIRIDKTPTDEEISWLWDKVRNCLDKEGEKGENKQSTTAANDQLARQTPVLSTKIIDGNSLGLNTNGAPSLRPGSGYFYTRNGGGANTNGQNKIKPAVQQQGSYLRRYGLLQQRRVHSATGTPSNALAVQARAGSAGLSRYPAAQTTQQQQHQQIEGPKPIAFSYKPAENVSESTAAFIMAERLAKQSLTDSHIAVAMEDAHSKQEVYNRARVPVKAGAGPSALSLEEQRLMESLDRLNEKLNVPEQKSYSGTIHYHQPYQPHLPGFRGHQGYTAQRHHQPASPRGQHRSQSARIRQQIRQYR